MHEAHGNRDKGAPSLDFEQSNEYALLQSTASADQVEPASSRAEDAYDAAGFIDAYKNASDAAEYYALSRQMRPHREAIMAVAMQQYEQEALDRTVTTHLLQQFGTAAQAQAAAEIAKDGMSIELSLALQRIATPEVAPALEHQLGELLASTDPNWADVTDYLWIAEAAQQRYPTEADAWSRTIALARDFLIEDEYQNIGALDKTEVAAMVDRRIEDIRKQTQPDIVDQEHISGFFGRENDPDFHASRSFKRPEWQSGARPPLQTELADRTQAIPGLYALAEYGLASNRGKDEPHPVLERLMYREQSAPPYAVTLGLEVEVNRNVRMDRSTIGHLSPDQQLDILYQRRLNQFRSEQVGVPADKDADWEFSHLPARHYSVLTREVQALMALNLVNPTLEPHPIHVTIGNVTTEGPAGAEPAVLLRALETTGWLTTPERLLQPQRHLHGMPDGTWAYQCPNGLSERPAAEVMGSSRSAVELRTLELTSMGGLERALRTAYGLGSALSAYQQEAAGQSVSDNEQALSRIWAETSEGIQRLLTSHDLAHPSEWQAAQGKQERDGYTEGRMDDNFTRLAHLLEAAEQDPQSEGARLQSDMQSLLIAARSKTVKLLGSP